MKRKFVFAMVLLVIPAIPQVVGAAGSITGAGRFEKITGKPAVGYKYLYEWDLFLSASDNSLTGPFRRLGAPPAGDPPPPNEGYYRINDLPAGTYSILVNQADFFASPKVIPNVQLTDDQTTTLNVDLDIDYSTYFQVDQKWTDWGPWTWYQTFLATGTSVRGISWVMAGWNLYEGDWAEVSILADNGNPDIRQWTVLATKRKDEYLNAGGDVWVRWTSGEVPITPGKRYAVKIWVNGGFAIYYRDKDANSYAHGRAYDQDANPKDFDLNITVFVDKNNQIVTHTKHFPKLRGLNSDHNDTRWGQTFVATGTSLAAVDVFAAGRDVPNEDIFHLTWTVHKDGPGGAQIGPTKSTWGAYFAADTDLIGVSYNPSDIPLTPGRTYYIEFTNPVGFTPHTQEPRDRYDDGRAYKNGTATDEDCAMTIIEYTHVVYKPVGFAGYWKFDETRGYTADDSSGNDHTGTLRNTYSTNWRPGKVGHALEFDGIDDHVQITDYKGVLGSQPRTCAAWIQTTDTDGQIISWGRNDVGTRWIFRVENHGYIRAEVSGGAAVGSTPVNDGMWHHVAVVSDGTNTSNFKFYVDAKPDPHSVAASQEVKTAAHADVTIGAFSDGPLYFKGLLDEVVVFDQALTEQQIRQLYTLNAGVFLQACGNVHVGDEFRIDADINKDCDVDLTDLSFVANDWFGAGILAGDIFFDEHVNIADLLALTDYWLVSVTPGLVAHYRFDDAQGTTALDSSVNSLDATLFNMDQADWVQGRHGGALAFDGTEDYAHIIGYEGIMGKQSRTVCAWINTTQPDGVIVGWGEPSTVGSRWVFCLDANGRLRQEVGGGAIVGTQNLANGNWRHIAAVIQNDGDPDLEEVVLYVDGAEETPSYTYQRQIDTQSGPDVKIGTWGGTQRYFPGLIDDVRLYDRALNSGEIATLAM